MSIALGMHAGGAAVVVAIDDDLDVVGRWSLQLVDHEARPELSQPYHAAAEVLGIEKGRERIALCERTYRESADRILGAVIDELPATPAAAGLVLGSGKLASTLEAILESHVMLHMAEGEMLRTALRDAAEGHGLRVVGVREKAMADALKEPRLRELGKRLGPPWTKREKTAYLAACEALG
jgi:hypothetical protein